MTQKNEDNRRQLLEVDDKHVPTPCWQLPRVFRETAALATFIPFCVFLFAREGDCL